MRFNLFGFTFSVTKQYKAPQPNISVEKVGLALTQALNLQEPLDLSPNSPEALHLKELEEQEGIDRIKMMPHWE